MKSVAVVEIFFTSLNATQVLRARNKMVVQQKFEWRFTWPSLHETLLEQLRSCQWNITFFGLLLIIEGAAEKVLQFIMPHKSIYNRKTILTMSKMVFLNTAERLKSLLMHCFGNNKFVMFTFSELPSIRLVLHWIKMIQMFHYFWKT